jgi:putative hemolysin
VSGWAFAVVAATGMWVLGAIQGSWPPWALVLIAAAASAVVVFLLGQALPRAMAVANPEDVGLAAAPAASALVSAVYPVARALASVWQWALKLVTGDAQPDVPWLESEDARGRGTEEEGERESDEEELLEAVSDLGGKIVREVMVPRTDMVSVEDTATVADAVRTITEAGVSRLPVFHDTLDDIRGIVYAKDLLACLAGPECATGVVDHMRPALFVPITKPVGELLREMRRRTHIAIVADEYGGTAGLVTIEDLLEEIVGEIYDEYDPQVQMVADAGGGSFRVDARLPIGEWDEHFGTALEVEADTAGGLVAELAGHIPEVGESVEIEGLRIVVAEMEGNRVRQLIVEPAPRSNEREDDR